MAYESPVVRPETKTLPPLSNGDTLTVKKRLNQGERRAERGRLYQQTADGSRRVDPLQVGVSMVCAYLIDWTVKGLDGKVIDIRGKSADEMEAALDMLDPFVYDEIEQAIRDHETAILKERAAAKNIQGGEKSAPVISPSPSDATGESSGSENSTLTTTTSS